MMCFFWEKNLNYAESVASIDILRSAALAAARQSTFTAGTAEKGTITYKYKQR